MKFGIIGLGRMGSNLARHAMEKRHTVVVYDHDASIAGELAREGLIAASSLGELVNALEPPRIVFVYVPHGDPTERVCQDLRPLLSAGDIVVDGGNSHWLDSKRRHAFFSENGIHFLDMGTSGGLYGASHGGCFMVGGERGAYDVILPILKDLAVDDGGYTFVGAPGSGHFVKLVHNAIEFGMVQAIGEGVELLKRSDYDLDVPALFDLWMHGSVIRSWLVELMGNALRQQGDLDALSTYVEDTGEVKWVLSYALARDIPTPVVSTSQQALMDYRDVKSIAAKAVALLRNQFGGHPVHRSSGQPTHQ